MADMQIVARMCELYVSKRDGFIMMKRDGAIFMPKIGNRSMRLSDSNVAKHLDHEYAISVFAEEAGSKFLCLDIDRGGSDMAHAVMNTLLKIGFDHNMLHVSASGGKGYHIEIFFTAAIPYASLSRLYKHLLDQIGATESMIELRPTFNQAIKLPLSIHPRTSNICWFLDHDFLEPIESQDYVLKIVPVAVDAFDMIIKELPEPVVAIKECKGSGERLQVEWGSLLDPAEEGTRHNRMVKIASTLSNYGVDSETCWEQLLLWHHAQEDGYCRSSYTAVLRDITQIVRWAYKEAHPVSNPNELLVFAKEMQCMMQQPRRSTRMIYFLLLCIAKTNDRISQEEMSRILFIGPVTVRKEIGFLCSQKRIQVHPGRTKRTTSGFLCKQANQYTALKSDVDEKVKRSLKPAMPHVLIEKQRLLEDFVAVYYGAIQSIFGGSDLQRHMTPAEYRAYRQHINSARDAPITAEQQDPSNTPSPSPIGCRA